MTQEEKQLLLIDLCARLPHGVVIEITSDGGMVEASYDMKLDAELLADLLHSEDDFKPYLRPMSSMTQEEIDEYDAELDKDMDIVMSGALDKDIYITSDGKHTFSKNFVAHFGIDWLNKNMFDYRGLIPMGLALEAQEGLYKTNRL